MSPNLPVSSPPVRRRQTLLSKVRPRTAGAEQVFAQPAGRPHTGIWVPHQDGSYREAVSPFSHEPAITTTTTNEEACEVPETIEPEPLASFPKPQTRHRQSKSFSSIRQGVSEIRTMARGLSLSLRHKSSKRNFDVPRERDLVEDTPDNSDSKSGWFRGHRLPHRPSLSSLNALSRFHHSHDHPTPVLSNYPELPVFPEDASGGAAARAAAAAQNESVKVERIVSNYESQPAEAETGDLRDNLDVKPSLDSESGIEINLQDSVSSQDDLDFVRKDPMENLPVELMAQVLAFLDDESLKSAELVSRSWNLQASSPHVWREVFHREYHHHSNFSKLTNRPTTMGLGRITPNQDWKKIFAVRRTLENRWKEGKAAAIYLHGHQDSVYCVQFDENKIITGSRDRTIRVWDAHYPWPCLKVIGPTPPTAENIPIGPLAITPSSDSTGRSPFISICPPARSATDLASQQTNSTEFYHNASILCLQFDDDIMVTGSSDFTCIVWDIKNDYTPIRRLDGHRAGVLDVCFDDKYIVSCSKDTTICVWDRKTGQLVKRLLGHRGPVNAVQLRGDLVVSASGDGIAKLWNITSGLCIKEFASKDRGLACVEFSEDARTVLAGGNDQVIYQFDANTGELVNELNGHSGLVRSLHMDSANNRIVSGSYDMSVKVFDSKSGELTIDLPGWTTSWMLSANSDYRRIVATSQDSKAVIMDFGYGLDGIELLEG